MLSSETSFFVSALILKRTVTDVDTFFTLQQKFEITLNLEVTFFYRIVRNCSIFPLFKQFIINILSLFFSSHILNSF